MSADFNRIISFLKVCETGSIAGTARQMYISPQALNKQIRLLEVELGERLFYRSPKALQLTPFGTFFRARMEPVYQLYCTAWEQVDHYLSEFHRTVRVGFFPGVPKRRVIQPVITELMERMPDVQIELGSTEMDELYGRLRSHEIDLGIANVKPDEPIGDLRQIPLLHLPCHVVVSAEHPWAGRERVSWEELERFPVLFLAREAGPDREGFYSELKASTVQYTSSYNTMLAQLGVGRHYAVFPTQFEDLKDSGLQAISLPEDCSFEFVLALVYHPENRFAKQFDELSRVEWSF